MQELNFQDNGQPSKSGVYMVDRGGKQGKAFRYFNVETGKWSITCYDPQEAQALAGTDSALPFLPFHPNAVKVKSIGEVVKLVASPKMKVATVGNTKVGLVQAKPAKPKVEKTKKVIHADGSIFFRTDRQKWVVVVDGKQPAARPTKEAVIKWLQAKHPTIKPTILSDNGWPVKT